MFCRCLHNSERLVFQYRAFITLSSTWHRKFHVDVLRCHDMSETTSKTTLPETRTQRNVHVSLDIQLDVKYYIVLSVVSTTSTYVVTLRSKQSVGVQVLYNIDNDIRIGTAHSYLHLQNNIVYNIPRVYVDNRRSICIKYTYVEVTIPPDIQRWTSMLLDNIDFSIVTVTKSVRLMDNSTSTSASTQTISIKVEFSAQSYPTTPCSVVICRNM